MSLLTKFRDLFKFATPSKSLYAGQIGEPPIRSTREFLEVYETTPWVRAISSRVAGEVGLTKWGLKRSDTDATVRRHILLDTLRRPNGAMSGSGLARVTQLSLDLVGDAFWLLRRNALGAPVEFWPIPPHWVAETPTFERPVFRIAWKSWQAQIPEADMVWLHDPLPSNPYARGSGIVRALADEVETDEYSAKHAKQIFFNRATPEFVVMDNGASETELKVHERVWRQKLQGLYKAMQPYFTNRDLKFWQPSQMNLENLTLVPLRKFERDIQLQCWGMPPEQLGIIENSNRATAEASDYIFQTRLIKPRRQFIVDELTMRLCPQYDPRLELTFLDTTPADKEYALNVAKAAQFALTINEWRNMMSLPPVPEGDIFMVPLQFYGTSQPQDNSQRPVNANGAGRPPNQELMP